MAVEILKDRFTIGNDFISKTYRIEKGRLTSFSLTHVLSGKTLTPAADSELFTLHFLGVLGGETIKAGELKVQDALKTEDAQGSGLKIFFKPFRVRGCKVELQYVETLGTLDDFLTAHLELRSEGTEKAVLDYLDFAPLRVPEGASVSGVRLPEKKKDPIVHLLGQPVFLENAFFSCSFPASVNAVCDGFLLSRRYYGRSLSALCAGSGVFVSDSAVCGVAAKSDPVAVRGAFLRCAKKLLPPVQTVNALWFDVSPLTSDAVQRLFLEEKRLQNDGERFYDCVLLDQRTVFPESAPFSFPDEIPLGLRSFSAAAASLGVPLGMAVGLPVKGKGLFRRKEMQADVCLADEKLIAAFQQFVQSLSEKCGVTDWQLHLPLDTVCRDKTHNHPLGGERQLYYLSDVFEKWINCLCLLKKTAKKPLHFSLCGVLSPWLLQWVDALAPAQSDEEPVFDRMLFTLKKTGVCVPTERLFLPQQSAPYPVAFAKRTLFALHTPTQTLCALRRQQTQLSALLCRAEPFGAPEKNEPYALAAFDVGEGLLVLCNPTGEERALTLTLDETLGVPPRFLCVGMCALLPSAHVLRSPFRYGDHLTQTLSPYETRLLHLGRRKTPLSVCAAATDAFTLHLRFDQPVDCTDAACAENPVQAVTSDADACGAVLRFSYPFTQSNTLKLSGVRDLFGESSDVSVSFLFSENGLLPPGALSGTGAFSIKATFGSETNLQMYLQTERLTLAAEDGHITFKVGGSVLRSISRTDDAVQVCAVREKSGTLKLYLNGKLDNTLQPVAAPTALLPAAPLCFDEKRTKLYSRALAFDEV